MTPSESPLDTHLLACRATKHLYDSFAEFGKSLLAAKESFGPAGRYSAILLVTLRYKDLAQPACRQAGTNKGKRICIHIIATLFTMQSSLVGSLVATLFTLKKYEDENGYEKTHRPVYYPVIC